MSCQRVDEIDLAGFLASPRDEAHAAFREHYPVCAECAAEVRAFTELDLLLRGPETHPAPDVLLRWEDEPMSLPDARRAELDRHVASCAGCRDELRALRGFAQALATERAPGVESVPAVASVFERLRGWLWNPALAYALVLVLLVPLVLQRWNVIEEERNLMAPGLPSAETPVVPTAERPVARTAERRSVGKSDLAEPPAEPGGFAGRLERDERPAASPVPRADEPQAPPPARARELEKKEYAVARKMVQAKDPAPMAEAEEAPAFGSERQAHNAPVDQIQEALPSAGLTSGGAGSAPLADERAKARKRSAADADSKLYMRMSPPPEADALEAPLLADLDGDERVFVIPAARLPTGASELELRIRLAGGRRELVERHTPAPDGSLEVRVPASWLAPGLHSVEVSVPGAPAGSKQPRSFVLQVR